MRITKLNLKEQIERREELYFICVAIDGEGRVIPSSSRILRNLDEDEWYTVNHFIYPPNDPKGFLNVGIVCMESDENSEHSKAVEALGKIDIGGVGQAGQVLSVVQSLQKDDFYGYKEIHWITENTIKSNIGKEILDFNGKHSSYKVVPKDLILKVEYEFREVF